MSEFVYMDIEIAKSLPENIDDWRDAGPLGISCAATVTSVGTEKLWYSVNEDGEFLPRMTPKDVSRMAAYMADIAYMDGYIVTWNGLSFDMPIVAEECCDDEWLKELARLSVSRHIDLGFLMHCEKGYFIALDKCAKGLGLSGKTKHMHGSLAPILWNGTNEPLSESMLVSLGSLGNPELASVEARQLCLDYVMQDAITTKEVYEQLLSQGEVRWTTKDGRQSKFPYVPAYMYDGRLILSDMFKPWDEPSKEHFLHRGQGRFPTVAECFDIPMPDVGWMNREPKKRIDFYKWTQKGEN